jgi:lipid A ethanolaminephosphotransferase
VLLVSLVAVFRPLSSLMRNHKELRYLITPANVLWSTGAVIAADFKGAARPREAIGLDARPGPSWASRQKPLVVVLIVGETTRTANWGLAGYARQTTPELARLPVVSLPSVSSCGTNTEVSLPCMFAPVGRRDYDEERIRGQESALHVLARAGVAVHWRDNQSGCKGVCEGLPSEELSAVLAPGLCPDGRCFDEGLVRDLDERLQRARGTQVWVLHMLGSHGPSYYRRYPASFARFLPDCRKDELRDCSQEEIINAYDNSVLYTDHVVASAVSKLRAARDKVDSALIFVSDHGESLGENGLYLHGMPYAVAPKAQTEVPMVMWTSPGLAAAAGLRPNCLQTTLNGRSPEGLSHDLLFHTLLGLTDVRTQLHRPQLDLTSGCASSAVGAP